MLAKQGLVIFLVGTDSGILPVFSVKYVLDDFLEFCIDEKQQLSQQDLEEIKKIRNNPYYIVESYLFARLEFCMLPFYEGRFFK